MDSTMLESKLGSGVVQNINDSDLESAFRKMLDVLQIPNNRRDEFLRQPKQMKWNMVCTHRNLSKSYGRSDTSPQGILLQLQNVSNPTNGHIDLQTLVDIRVSFYPQSSRGTFIKEFLGIGGIDTVFLLLVQALPVNNSAELDTNNEKFEARVVRQQVECLKLVKCCMNTRRSLDYVSKNSEWVLQIALHLDPKNVEICTLVIEILMVIALFSSEGHAHVIQAMESYRVMNREPLRFFSIVSCLKSDDTSKYSMSFKALVLSFINTIINSTLGIEDRMSLRSDFVYLGIVDTLEDFEGVYEYMSCGKDTGGRTGSFAADSTFQEELDALMTQIKVFQNTADADNIQVMDIVDVDISNPTKVFESVHSIAATQGCGQELLEILQLLLLMPRDPNMAISTWSILVEACQKIVAMPDQVDDSFMTYSSIAERLEQVQHQPPSKRDRKTTEEEGASSPPISQGATSGGDSELKVVLERNRELEEKVKGMQESNRTAAEKQVRDLHALTQELEQVKKKLSEAEQSANKDLSSAAPVATNETSKASQSIPEEYHKYLKMKNVGLPEGAIRNAAARDGLDGDTVLKAINQASAPSGEPEKSAASPPSSLPTVTEETPDRFSKYRKMLKAGLPVGAILHRMAQDGVENPSIEVLEGTAVAIPNNQVPTNKGNTLDVLLQGGDPKYEKYRKMKLAGLPTEAIEHAMKKDNVEVPAGSQAPVATEEDSKPFFMRSEDEKYAKYKRMMNSGLPMGAIENAMRRDQIDVEEAMKTASGVREEDAKPKKPKKKVVKSNVPLRALFWNKIPDADVDNTIWKNLSDEHVELDLKSIEQNFSKRASNILGGRQSSGELTVQKQNQSKKAVQILDSKRTQNVAIAIAKLRMTPQQIKEAILQLDEEKLGGPKGSEEQVVLVQRVIPTQEEVDLIKQHNTEDLGKVEKHFLVMASIPRIEQRIEAWRLMMRFDHVCAECDHEMNIVQKAMQQVRDSEAWKRTMEVVLAIGNFLNGSSARGGAYGFKLDVLTKIANIKTMDNKGNLLQYIAREVAVKSHREMLKLGQELSELEFASHTSLTDLQDGVRGLEKAARFISSELEQARNAGSQNDSSDKFVIKMIPFLSHAERRVAVYRKRMDALDSAYNTLKQELGETDSGAYRDSSELFGLVRTFVTDFMREATSSPLFGSEPKRTEVEEKDDSSESESTSGSESSSDSDDTEGNGSSGVEESRSKSLFELVRASQPPPEQDSNWDEDDLAFESEGSKETESLSRMNRRESVGSNGSSKSNGSSSSKFSASRRALAMAHPKNSKPSMFDKMLSSAHSGDADDIVQNFAKRRTSSMASTSYPQR